MVKASHIIEKVTYEDPRRGLQINLKSAPDDGRKEYLYSAKELNHFYNVYGSGNVHWHRKTVERKF